MIEATVAIHIRCISITIAQKQYVYKRKDKQCSCGFKIGQVNKRLRPLEKGKLFERIGRKTNGFSLTI